VSQNGASPRSDNPVSLTAAKAESQQPPGAAGLGVLPVVGLVLIAAGIASVVLFYRSQTKTASDPEGLGAGVGKSTYGRRYQTVQD